MAATANSDTELLTEHFGYPPVSLIDDIINSVNILAERALNSVEQGLLNAPPATLGFRPSKKDTSTKEQPELDPVTQAKNEIEAGTHQLETLLCASVDRDFDKFEIYVLRNIFCLKPADIGNYIRLSHYDGLDFSQASDGGDSGNGSTKATLDSVNAIRRQLRESMRLNALLHAEHERNARLLADLQTIVGAGAASEVKAEDSASGRPSVFGFLREGVAPLKDSGADTPLGTTAAFTLSQLQALRAASRSLRAMMPDLAAPPPPPPPPSAGDDLDAEIKLEDGEDGDGGRRDKKSWRRERLEYVEGATRRHLENVQGLELGKDGEVRDGEWQGEGRRFGRGEVEGLERVVALLGGAGGQSRGAAPSNGGAKADGKADEGDDNGDGDEDAMVET